MPIVRSWPPMPYVVWCWPCSLSFSPIGLEVKATEGGTARGIKGTIGLHRSKKIVFKLSGLFALDAFGGAFVVQSMIAWWLHLKFGVDEGTLGTLFFWANLLAGFSALAATRLAERIGLVATMVYTHIPSNILLCLVPLMPNLWSGCRDVVPLRPYFRTDRALSASPIPWRWWLRMNVLQPRA